MVDDLEYTDDEEFEDEYEDEFEDEYEDDFDDDFDDFEEENVAFGPVYVQGKVSQGFEDLAVFLTVLAFLGGAALIYLTFAGSTGNLLSMLAVSDREGTNAASIENDATMGEVGGGVPTQVRVLGVASYASDADGFDFALLDAGAKDGMIVGMTLTFAGQTLAVVQVDPDTSRAEFVTIDPDAEPFPADSIQTGMVSSDDYATIYTVDSLSNTVSSGGRLSMQQIMDSVGETYEMSPEGTISARPGDNGSNGAALPSDLRLHRAQPIRGLAENIVYEASDGTGRHSSFVLYNYRWNILSPAQFSVGDAEALGDDESANGAVLQYRGSYFATVTIESEQVLLNAINAFASASE